MQSKHTIMDDEAPWLIDDAFVNLPRKVSTLFCNSSFGCEFFFRKSSYLVLALKKFQHSGSYL